VWREKKKCALRICRGGIDADLLARAATLELHDPLNEGEEGVVATQTHVETRKEFRAALTDDDRPRFDGLAAVGFYPKVLWVTVPPPLFVAMT
jgi:hypothetical protein